MGHAPGCLDLWGHGAAAILAQRAVRFPDAECDVAGVDQRQVLVVEPHGLGSNAHFDRLICWKPSATGKGCLNPWAPGKGWAPPRVNPAVPRALTDPPPDGGGPPRRCPALGAVAIEASVLPALPLPGPASMRCALDASALVACGPGPLLWRNRA